MQDLNYHPNFTAQSLVNKRTRIMSLFYQMIPILSIKIPFFLKLFEYKPSCNRKGYAIQLSTGVDDEQRLETVRQMVDGLRVDGLIFLYSQENDPIVAYVQSRKFPFVILGMQFSAFVSLVDNDNIRANFMKPQFIFLKKATKMLPLLAGTRSWLYPRIDLKVTKRP